MTTTIHDITIYEPGENPPANADAISHSMIEAGAGHVAVWTATGEWMATYVDGAPAPGPGSPCPHWESVEDFHRWIRWARG